VVHEGVPAICIEDKPLFFNIEKPSSPKKTATSLKFTHVTSGILSCTFTVLLAVHQKISARRQTAISHSAQYYLQADI
jgi:hypothetical protein